MAGLDKRTTPMPVTESTELAVQRWISGKLTVFPLHIRLIHAQPAVSLDARAKTAAWETDTHHYVTLMDAISTPTVWAIHPFTARA